MKIELSKEDIINEIKDNYIDDTDFCIDIIDTTTTSWESIRIITKSLITLLKNNNELNDLLELE